MPDWHSHVVRRGNHNMLPIKSSYFKMNLLYLVNDAKSSCHWQSILQDKVPMHSSRITNKPKIEWHQKVARPGGM
jgi:hypothetical protein